MHPQRTGCVKCGAGGAGRQSGGSRNMGSRDVGTEHLAAARGLRAAELNTRGQVAAHNVSRQRDKKVRAGRACVGRATVHEKRVGNRDPQYTCRGRCGEDASEEERERMAK